MDNKYVLVASVAILLVLLIILFSPQEVRIEKKKTYTILGPDLKPLGEFNHLPDELNGLVPFGTTEEGEYVYVPREGLYTPKLYDRLNYLAGRLVQVSFPITWWAEYKGRKIYPLTNKAYRGYEIVIQTPYEVIKTRKEEVGVYNGKWYLGVEREANNECIYVKRWRKWIVPLLLNGRALLDPDAEKVCRDCNTVKVRVVDGNGKPLGGFFSEGNGDTYTFFGEFSGVFDVCRCSYVKIYSSGFKSWSGTVCEDRNITLKRLEAGEQLEGNYIYLDTTGALASVGPSRAEVGSYTAFSRFPLREVNVGLPSIELSSPVWYGYKQVRNVPIYSVVRRGNEYFYTLEEGLVPLNGFLCSGNVCTTPGDGTPVLGMGSCTLEWNGSLISPCPTLKVKYKTSESIR